MPDLLDIHLDFDTLHLAAERDATRTVYEASHAAAMEAADRKSRRLRHTEPAETVLKHAQDPTTGRDVLLVGTRWVTD